MSGEPIPVPKVDPADKERFDKTVDEIHAKVGPAFRVLKDLMGSGFLGFDVGAL